MLKKDTYTQGQSKDPLWIYQAVPSPKAGHTGGGDHKLHAVQGQAGVGAGEDSSRWIGEIFEDIYLCFVMHMISVCIVPYLSHIVATKIQQKDLVISQSRGWRGKIKN